MNHASLFSGIGGLDLAAHWAGMKTVVMCERESYCQKVLNRQFPGVPIIDDIRNFTRERVDSLGVGRIDIISGGFPCQPFSHAGKRKGTADDRHLWPEMLRVIADIRPTWVFGENVDGLVSMAQSDGETVMENETTLCTEAEMVIEGIRKDLQAIGYQSIPVVIPASAIGAKHRRYRIFILGYAEHHGSYGSAVARSTNQASDRCENGQNEAGQSPGASGRANDEALADSRSVGLQRGKEARDFCEIGEEPKLEQFSGRDRGHKALADASSERFREAREHIERSKTRATGGSENVADSERIRQPRSRKSIESSDPAKDRKRQASGTIDVCVGTERAAQSRMGGVPYELSTWMDGCGVNPLDALIDFISSCPQVAPLGMPQYDWEPPRVANGIKNRAARLKALGNAVDPLQALPVMYGIRILHEGGFNRD